MRAKLLVIVWSLLLAAGCRRQGPPAGAEPPERFDLKAIDEYVAQQVQDRGLVGLSLAIMQDGKIVLRRGYGKGSLSPAAAADADTAFGIGSVTKEFTCASLLLLQQEGKLSVEDKVARYYPDLTRAADITLKDLGSHLSGYPDYYPLDFVDRRLQRPIAPDLLIKEYASGKLDFEPGTRWSYSNTGFILLGRVVEKVSGEPFGAFLSRRILKPLGMEHSAFEPPRDEKGLARGYTSFALGPPEAAPPEQAGWLYTAGGLFSTASDLARWDLALIDGKVLGPGAYQLMTTPRKLKNGRGTDYACGLAVSHQQGEVVLQHDGAVSGFLAYNAMVPRTRSAVVMLVNSDFIDVQPLHKEVLSLLLREQREVPRVQGPRPGEIALDLLHQMQAGKLDRGLLGEEFSIYLGDERVRAAAVRLKALGEPLRVEVDNVRERGGMEVAHVRFKFKATVAGGLLYRTPDGKVQQFLIVKE